MEIRDPLLLSVNFTIVSLKFPGKTEQAPTCGYCQYPNCQVLPFSLFVQLSDGGGCVGWGGQEEEPLSLVEGTEAFLGSRANVTGPRRARPGHGRFAQGPVHTGPCQGLPTPGKCNHRKAEGKPISPKFLRSQRLHPQLSCQHFRHWRGETLLLKHRRKRFFKK